MQEKQGKRNKPGRYEKQDDSYMNRRKAETAGFNSGARPRREKQKGYPEKEQRPFDKQQRPFDKQQRPFDKQQRPFGKKQRPFDKQQKESDNTLYRETVNVDMEEAASDKLEGRNSVLEALKSDRTINKIMIAKGAIEGSIRQIMSIAREKGLVVQEVDKTALDKIASTRAHQGVIAFTSVKDYVNVDDILALAEQRGEPPFIVILDGITDPHNLGAIIRTADAAGVHGIIIPKRRAIGLTPVVSKASAGAIEYVAVARVPNISQTIEYLKTKNIWVVGTDSTGDRAYHQGDLKGAIALVVGGEGEGIGKLVREKCDFVVNIPMKGRISSLNASVAAAIIMYEIYKQRGQ